MLVRSIGAVETYATFWLLVYVHVTNILHNACILLGLECPICAYAQ